MAGFLKKFADSNFVSNVSEILLKLSSLGMVANDLVVKQSQAIGQTEAMFASEGGAIPEDLMYTLALADITTRKYISFFDKDYKNKREFLRKFAMNGEIEFVIDTVCDESIVYDEKNFFCYPDYVTIGVHLKEEIREKVSEKIDKNFKFLYNRFHFNDDITAWNFFKKFLIDGFLAFEIIYDEDNKNIIGFKELDAMSLRPSVEQTPDGFKRYWLQYEDTPTMRRKLTDSQIIYIAFAQGNFMTRVSYVERLVRSFNLLRIMENTRLIWSLMNSTYRMKMTVPIGNKSKQKAQESLKEMLSVYKEDIYLDFDSGELLVNGKPSMQFYKNYLLPSKNGEHPDIETVAAEGPDLSDTDALKYFYKKLQVDSKIPFSRFDRDNNGGQVYLGAEGLDREEVRFSKFINRLRSVFQEILMKPLFLQMALDFPELAEDELFKTSLGIKFNKDNIFEQMKFQEITQKKLDFINSLADYTQQDGTTPFWDKRFLVDRFLGFTKDDMKANENYLKKAKEESKDSEKDDKEDVENAFKI